LEEIKNILSLPQLDNEFNSRPRNIRNTFDLLYTSQEINTLKKAYENLKNTTNQTIKAMNISLSMKELLKSKEAKTLKIIEKLKHNERNFGKLEEKEIQHLINEIVAKKVQNDYSDTL